MFYLKNKSRIDFRTVRFRDFLRLNEKFKRTDLSGKGNPACYA